MADREQEPAQEPEQEPEQQADERAGQEKGDDEAERERRERLDPDNRPDDAEVDNTQREFDEQKGMFTDDPEYDGAPVRFPPAAEQDS